jgi:hypothetical protein
MAVMFENIATIRIGMVNIEIVSIISKVDPFR